MSSEAPKVEAIRQRARRAYEGIYQWASDLEELLPSELLYRPAAPGEWSIMQNLAHVIEIMPYWGDEIARLVAVPGQAFGRTQEHEGRLLAIQEHANDTLKKIRAVLPHSYYHLDHVLATLTDQDLELTGNHSKFKTRSLDWFIEDFVTQHLENHLAQIKAAYEALKPT